MNQTVTPEMRAAVSDALVREIRSRGESEKGPLHFPDALTLLIHHEMTRGDDAENPKTTISEFADLLLMESCEEETIHEYCALKKHVLDNTFTRVMLLRGLHHHRRNRSWMDLSDPKSVQRNTALIRAIVLLRSTAREQLLREALEYNDYGDANEYGQCFREPECVDLIIDYPEHYEQLIVLMLERGYANGTAVFREMMRNNVPALNIGVL